MTDQNRLLAYFGEDIEIFDCLPSTNSRLKDRIKQGKTRGVCLAFRQSAGRGRLGRSFSSDAGGLYMSFIDDIRGRSLGKITSRAAVSALLAVEEMFSVSLSIKWVNDLLWSGKKLGGILCEGVFMGEEGRAVIGIGINLLKSAVPDALLSIATGLLEKTPDLAPLLIRIYENYQNLDEETVHALYKQRLVTLGKEISYVSGGETRHARALDIDENAGLLIEENGQRKTLFFGEVSVRARE